jgi:hypothetical protein
MSDTSPSTAIVAIRSDEAMLEGLALVGFLAGYSRPTRDSYRTDHRRFTVATPSLSAAIESSGPVSGRSVRGLLIGARLRGFRR